jgi:hypothetical protein
MKLFPKIPITVAHEMATGSALAPIPDLAAASALDHPAILYSPVGGARARVAEVAQLREELRATAHANRYPLAATEGDRVTFDAQAARIRTRQMDISANEAADPRLWAFLACVVVPDIVRWRFPGGASGTSEERFVGKSRGLRNTLGRLWWRSHLLRTPDGAEDPLGRLGEDELVQITERTSIAGSPRLATQLADSFLEAVDRYPRVSRSILMRDAMKRIRRLAAFVEFDVLEDDGLFDLVDGVFEASARIAQAATPRAGREGSGEASAAERPQ